MPLAFKKIKPVDFEDFTAVPQMTTELKLRIQNLKFDTEAQIEKAKDTLSVAFPDEKEKVRAFMDENLMGAVGLQELQAYLLGGEEMLEHYRQHFNEVMKASTDKTLRKLEAERVNDEVDG